MSKVNRMAPARAHTQPGRQVPVSKASCTSGVPQRTPLAKCNACFRIVPDDGVPFKITLKVNGREAWTLNELVRAGKRGCIPVERPSPRWSAYVHRLRLLGVPIATMREKHGGDFPGWHARYVLLATVTRENGQ